MNEAIYNYIGLMYKANMVKIGFKEFKSLNMLKKVFLVLYSCDASEKVKKDIIYYCSINNIMYHEWGTKHNIGKSIGRNSDVAVISITDKRVACKLKNLIESIGGEIIGEN